MVDDPVGGAEAYSMGLVVQRVTEPTDEVRALLTSLDAALSANYPPEQRHGLRLEALFEPNIHFFVARRDGTALGCGGVALLGTFAEVKRMYVDPAARGSGVAQALLAQVEAAARSAGLAWLRLETGTEQHAAMRLYERAGFRRCGPFGDYAGMAPHAIATSVFMEKALSPTDS